MTHGRGLLAGLAILSIAACAPPSDLLNDGLDAPGGGRPTPPIDPVALFPNAPTEAGWSTVSSTVWTQPVPYRLEPIYDPDNGTHLVEYGNRDWGRQSSIVDDDLVPGPVGTALNMRLPSGLPGGYSATKIGQHPDWSGDGPLRWDPALSTGHLFVGVFVRFSPDFTLNGNVHQKVLYLKSDLPENRAIAHIPVGMLNDGNRGDQLWPGYVPQSPFQRYTVPNVGENDLNDGRWHLVELLQAPNVPGQSNGRLRMWIDGRLLIDRDDAIFFDVGQTPSLNRLEIEPIFGGGSFPSPRDQWVRVGPLFVRSR
jgi:hypothetical protein